MAFDSSTGNSSSSPKFERFENKIDKENCKNLFRHLSNSCPHLSESRIAIQTLTEFSVGSTFKCQHYEICADFAITLHKDQDVKSDWPKDHQQYYRYCPCRKTYYCFKCKENAAVSVYCPSKGDISSVNNNKECFSCGEEFNVDCGCIQECSVCCFIGKNNIAMCCGNCKEEQRCHDCGRLICDEFAHKNKYRHIFCEHCYNYDKTQCSTF